MLYAPSQEPVVGGVAPARVVTALPEDDRGPTWLVTDDPVLVGLWTAAVGERPQLGGVTLGPGPLPAVAPAFERLTYDGARWGCERWERAPVAL
ncbi:MAG: hypothetical protein ABMA64_16450, partial [Myxococcota bacterium]